MQSAHALRQAIPAIRANLNNCTKGYVPSEDGVITCVHKALKSSIVNLPGMYINTVASVARGEHVGAAMEGLVKYPITFHWVSKLQDTCPMLSCYFCTEHMATEAVQRHGSGFAHCAVASPTLAASSPAILSACRHLFTPFRPQCPRYFVGERTKFAGLGQQVYELMFLVQAAAKNFAVPVFEPFAPPAVDAKWLKKIGQTAHHGHYEWANDLFGLPALFKSFAVASLPSSGSSLMGAKRMKELNGLKHRSGQCGENDDKSCCGVYLTKLPCAANCWVGGSLLAADEFASCARVASPILGTWMQKSPFTQQKHKTVNIVVHLRVGDVGGVWPTYEHLVAALAPVCSAYKCAMHLIGGGDKKLAGVDETAGKVGGSVKSALHGLLRKRWALATTVTSHTGSAKEALLMMMHADVLVSSGSSFPIVAAVFSDTPVLIDWRGGKSAAFGEPITTHFLRGSVIVDISGKLSNAAIFQLHTSLLPKMWKRGFHRLSLKDEKQFFPCLMAKQSAARAGRPSVGDCGTTTTTTTTL